MLFGNNLIANGQDYWSIFRLYSSLVSTHRSSVISKDGNTLCIVSLSSGGTAYYFDMWTRSAGTWTHQQNISISMSDTAGNSAEPVYFAQLSAAGEVLVIRNLAGATYAVYKRSGNTWSVYDSTTTAAVYASMHIIDSGATFFVGNSTQTVGANTNAGQIIPVTDNGSQYAVGTVINNPVPATGAFFGRCFKVSGDNTTLAAGDNLGRLLIMTNSGGTWSLAQNISLGFTPYRIAISTDGTIITISETSAGYVQTYVKSGGTWSLNASYDTRASGLYSNGPYDLAMSADGSLIVVSVLGRHSTVQGLVLSRTAGAIALKYVLGAVSSGTNTYAPSLQIASDNITIKGDLNTGSGGVNIHTKATI